MPDETPERIGDHLPERLLGRGAMASVYLCRAPDGRAVALKWLSTEHPPLVRRFQREIDVLSRLDHPGIVASLGSGRWEGRPYLVMEYVAGLDLRLYASKLWKRPPAERYARARDIGRQLALALQHMHERQLIHRDLKPSNVLVADDGRILLTDLGVVKDLDEFDKTAVGLMIGTVAYAAPEQLQGERVDHRADLYGLGATLYYLLTLRRPFDGRERTADALPLPPSHHDPGLPPDLEAIILRLMEPRPSARYPDAAAVAAALAVGRVDGIAIAGRQRALEAVAGALEQAAAGARVLIRPLGTPGSGKGWLTGVARQGARRRGLSLVEVHREGDEVEALARLAGPEPVVVVATRDLAPPPGVESVTIRLRPLGVADVRRTVVGAAPRTPDAARVAAHLHQLTGGIPALVVSLLSRHTRAEALELPEEPDLPTLVEDWFEGLDVDDREVLGVIAVLGEPASPTLIEDVVQVPATPTLEILASRGLVRDVGGRWAITAELFRQAALSECADPEGLGERIAAARIRRARAMGGGPGAEALQSEVAQGRVDALGGRLAEALERLRRVAGLAQALGDRTGESEALVALGHVLLDMGLFRRARRRLADATALARASDQDAARRLSHVLRAATDLGERPGDRTAAAGAIDRLMPVLTGRSGRSTDLADALGSATWARAAGVLGDGRTHLRAREQALRLADDLPLAERLRVLVALARAAAAQGDPVTAHADLSRVRACGRLHPLLLWQAEGLAAALEGQAPPPPPPSLVAGLAVDERAAMAALGEWVRPR